MLASVLPIAAGNVKPYFGAHVLVFNPSMAPEAIQEQIDKVYVIRPNFKFHSLITVRLGNNGEISNVINDTGGPTGSSPRVAPKVTAYP
jgi:hypothetical protein